MGSAGSRGSGLSFPLRPKKSSSTCPPQRGCARTWAVTRWPNGDPAQAQPAECSAHVARPPQEARKPSGHSGLSALTFPQATASPHRAQGSELPASAPRDPREPWLLAQNSSEANLEVEECAVCDWHPITGACSVCNWHTIWACSVCDWHPVISTCSVCCWHPIIGACFVISTPLLGFVLYVIHTPLLGLVLCD